MKNIKNIIISVSLFIISIIYTVMVKYVDVKQIGPNNSSVGFSGINKWFSNLIGSNMTIYKISELLGYIIMLLVLIYGFIGLYQFVKRKKITKVDKEIIILPIEATSIGNINVQMEANKWEKRLKNYLKVME